MSDYTETIRMLREYLLSAEYTLKAHQRTLNDGRWNFSREGLRDYEIKYIQKLVAHDEMRIRLLGGLIRDLLGEMISVLDAPEPEPEKPAAPKDNKRRMRFQWPFTLEA